MDELVLRFILYRDQVDMLDCMSVTVLTMATNLQHERDDLRNELGGTRTELEATAHQLDEARAR